MLVYGCRCAPVDLGYLPSSADADFILDYALLMFNRFTRGTSVVHGTGPLTPEFWAAAECFGPAATTVLARGFTIVVVVQS